MPPPPFISVRKERDILRLLAAAHTPRCPPPPAAAPSCSAINLCRLANLSSTHLVQSSQDILLLLQEAGALSVAGKHRLDDRRVVTNHLLFYVQDLQGRVTRVRTVTKLAILQSKITGCVRYAGA